MSSSLASGRFTPFLSLWNLTADGAPIVTHSSELLPVRLTEGTPGMLKVAVHPEEIWAGGLMVWWDGDGAARVLAHEGPALLLERLPNVRKLAEMARAGGASDDEATRIICDAAAKLHAQSHRPPPPALTPLTQWFEPLVEGPPRDEGDGVLRRAAATARMLLASPREVIALHGDLHHENILDAGARGWLAIDPKRLGGERTFDFANIFRDPDDVVATRPGRFARQAHVIAEAARVDRVRLLQWTLAFCGLSAVWALDEGESPAEDLAIATLADAELGAAARNPVSNGQR
jgi:streptomycin 6-kinase